MPLLYSLMAAGLLIISLVGIRKHPRLASAGLLIAVSFGVWTAILLVRVSRIYEYAGTRAAMEDIAQALKDENKKSGSFPKGLTLADLKPGVPLHDAWGRPFELKTTGDSFVLTSWGRDGIKGGVGFDQDLIAGWRRGSLTHFIESADFSP